MKELFIDQILQKGLMLTIQIDKLQHQLGYLTEVFQDKQRIQQVLANLISNSIKYSKEGIISIKA
jgi:signal transduction histidine kinase